MRINYIAQSIVLLGLAGFGLGCQPQPPPAPPDTRAADEQAIRAADSEWSKAAGAKDLDRFISFFADDASELSPNMPILTGKEAIRKWISEMMANPGFAVSWQTSKVDVARSGDLGYTLGSIELRLNDAKGKPVTDRGKYLTVWKKQTDGSWKVAVDTFNSDLPLAAPSRR